MSATPLLYHIGLHLSMERIEFLLTTEMQKGKIYS